MLVIVGAFNQTVWSDFDVMLDFFCRPFAAERESIEKAFQEKLNAQEVNINVTFTKLVLFEQERLMTKLNGQNEVIENQKETIEVTNDFKVYDVTFFYHAETW